MQDDDDESSMGGGVAPPPGFVRSGDGAGAYDEEKNEKEDADLTDDDDDDDDVDNEVEKKSIAGSVKEYKVAVVGIFAFEKTDPRHMPFKKNDKFMIIEPTEDEAPWYEAKKGDEVGLVPANRVYILKPGETEAPSKKKARGKAESEVSEVVKPEEEKLFIERKKSMAIFKAVALKDFSTDKNGGFSFTRGDLVDIDLGTSSDWVLTKFNGMQAMVPVELLRFLDDDEMVALDGGKLYIARTGTGSRDARTSTLKSGLQYDHMTGNKDPARSSIFGKKNIRDVPLFAALFAFKGGLPQDANVEAEGMRIVDNNKLDDGESSVFGAVAKKKESRLTNVVSSVSRSKKDRADNNAAATSSIANKDVTIGTSQKNLLSTTNSTAPVSALKKNTAFASDSNKRSGGLSSSGNPTTSGALLALDAVARVSNRELATIEKQLRFQILPEGSTIFSQGTNEETQRNLYAILEGEVELTVSGESFGSLRAGHFFGPEALIVEDLKRSFTAVTKGPTTILIVIPFFGHRLLCKQLPWYEDAMRCLYKTRCGAFLQRLALFHRLEQSSLEFLGLRSTFKRAKKGQGFSEMEYEHLAAASLSSPAPPQSTSFLQPMSPLNGNAGGSFFQSGAAATSSVTADSTETKFGFFLVVSGYVAINVKLPDGTKRELRKMGPGQFFGEGSLLGWDSQIGNAVALVPSLVLNLSKTDLDWYCVLEPKARSEVARATRYRTSELLRTLPFINLVPTAKQEVLAAAFEFSLKSEGDEIYSRSLHSCFYIVCEGGVEIQDDRGDVLRTLRNGSWFGDRALGESSTASGGAAGGRPAAMTMAGADSDETETAIAVGPNASLCLALSREGFERFLETAPEIRTQLRAAVGEMITQQQESLTVQIKMFIPTSADELACVTQLPSEFLSKDEEAKSALEMWGEIGKIIAPCLKTLQGHPQYLHPVPFDFGGRDPMRKFNVTIVKIDERMDSIKVETSAAETVGDLIRTIFDNFAHMRGGAVLDPAGPGAFGLKIVSRAEYLLEKDVELGRYKCVTAALRRGLDKGELALVLVDLRINPKSGPGLRQVGKKMTTNNVAASSMEVKLMEAVAIYDYDGGLGGLAFKAGDRLEVEPRMGESLWPAVLITGRGNGASGLVPQNFVKAIGPISGPARGANQVYGPQLPAGGLNRAALTAGSGSPMIGGSASNSTSASEQYPGLPTMSLEEWAKAVADGYSRVERLPPPWGKAGASAAAAIKPTAWKSSGQVKASLWPLRVRLRGFERLFAIPNIERCSYLQVRVELVFGGQVLEKKMSKIVKRNSVLRFEDEWFYFSKFASDLNFTTRIVLTLLGLDVNDAGGGNRKGSADDDDNGGGGGGNSAVVRKAESNVSLAITATSDASRKGGGFFGFGRKPTAPSKGGRPHNLSLSSEMAGSKSDLGTIGLAATLEAAGREANAGESNELELAGVSFSLYGSDLALRGGVMTYGLWTGQGGDRVLFCVENYDHDSARVLVELDKYDEPVIFPMSSAVVPKFVPLDITIGIKPAAAGKSPLTRPGPSGSAPGSSRTLNKQPPPNVAAKVNNRRTSSAFVARGDGFAHLLKEETAKPTLSKKVFEILSRNPLQMYLMSDVDKSILWNEREMMVSNPFALSKVMLAVNWTNPTMREQALLLLGRWTAPAPMQALELLDARFGEYRLREYAVKCLEDFDDEELADFLLQLVQVLKFEFCHDSPLARFLIRRALANPREIGNKLFWGLRAEMHVKRFAPRFGLILKAYLKVCGQHFAELAQQHDVQELLISVARSAQKMKNASKADRTAHARAAVAQINERITQSFQLPLDPRMRAARFNPEGCRIMSSKKRPLWISLESVDPPECGGEKMLVMFKAGDDLRQDQMTLQILRVMEQIWLAEGMNLRLTPYGCIATGDEVGMLEIVPDSETIAMIETSQGGTFGSLKDTPIRKFLERHNKGREDQAIDNFVRSCAGYCVATYIIGLGDRHNDNILCCHDGRLFHIDFGHFLGNFKTIAALGGFKRERTPFVLTKGMAYAMGGKGTEEFARFQDLCGRALLAIRRHSDELVTLFRLMVPAGMPELTCDEDIQYMVDQLHLEKTDEEAMQIFTGEINSAIGDLYRRLDNFLHTVKHS